MLDSTMPPPSWVPGADACEGFGLNHLPYGAIETEDGVSLHTRIGDFALDLRAAVEKQIFTDLPAELQEACRPRILNSLLALGPVAWARLRKKLQETLAADVRPGVRESAGACLRPLARAKLVLPLQIGDYTDFYASIHHARRVGELFRPEAPLLPNYKHVPIGYHGRASSIVVSGTPIRRPWGQVRPATLGQPPTFAPTAALDSEMELAFVVGTGNELGIPVPFADAETHLFGVVLLNDWSARDIQSWEYRPLGPFLGKSFATTIGAWITPLSALEPFRTSLDPRPDGDPEPLSYLGGESSQSTFDISVRATLATSREANSPLGKASIRQLYWSPAQMVTHHTSNGCNLRPGDVLATGTISGPELENAGCLLERTLNGTVPLQLSPTLTRRWLLDGDEVRLEALCHAPGEPSIRLGSAIGKVIPEALSNNH